MATEFIYLPPPPFTYGSPIDPNSPLGVWLTQVQQANPLAEVDTSDGPYTDSTPSAGNITPGVSAQGREITYIKTSADANVYTLSGTNFPQGPITLTTQYAKIKIKSDGTQWLISG